MKTIKYILLFLLVIILFIPVTTKPVGAAENMVFTDAVSPDYWGYDTIQWGLDKHIINGYPDNTIRPEASVKENEFLAMLVNYYKSDLSKNVTGFNWDSNYYAEAKVLNWPVRGGAVSVRPLVRAEVARLIVASATGLNYDYNNSIQYLFYAKLASGRSDQTIEGFNKNALVSRAEAVQFIRNLSNQDFSQAKPMQSYPTIPLLDDQKSDYLFRIWKGERYGYINNEGKIMIQPTLWMSSTDKRLEDQADFWEAPVI